ncbi:hypothetical protein NPIL_214111 [Nephila pilipes]|uniref:Uncharacterized protein n=1 Tax=Nephila pilipes TaxID=299642 RepID=A0A8X6P5D5_NEPPI|nr:hypothetical protein NPIL_214111 [Nephila pilipes]
MAERRRMLDREGMRAVGRIEEGQSIKNLTALLSYIARSRINYNSNIPIHNSTIVISIVAESLTTTISASTVLQGFYMKEMPAEYHVFELH